MPQMAPMLWLSLFLLSISVWSLVLTIQYFFLEVKKFPTISVNSSFKEVKFSWPW